MTKFYYEKTFQIAEDSCEFRKISSEYVATTEINGKQYLSIDSEAFRIIAKEAYKDVSFYLRSAHLEKVVAVIHDPDSSANDKYVAECLLKNAAVSAEGVLPMCQDTGTATIVAHKGADVLTDGNEHLQLSKGIFEIYQEKNLRYSQLSPLDMYEEINSDTNLPAQIDIYAKSGNEFDFLFIAKGGGSSNKTQLYQESKVVLNPKKLEEFLIEKMRAIGVAACPPYHLAIVVGGTSPEVNLKTVKLASAGYYDSLPDSGNKYGRAFRDHQLENELLQASKKLGFGAQFGGTAFAHDIRVIRLPRHAGSCPIGIGVSCSADRNIKGKITADGIFLEKLERTPQRFLAEAKAGQDTKSISIDLEQSMSSIISQLDGHKAGTKVLLTGTLIVSRDVAHARVKEILDESGDTLSYFKNHPIYYAGPAKTPSGMASGSFGPTTAQRMDGYVAEFMANGASRIMLAKGNRSPEVAKACHDFNGFYLGTIGGAAALVAEENIISSEIIDFADLGMEAVRKITVKNLPAFIISDNQGNSLY